MARPGTWAGRATALAAVAAAVLLLDGCPYGSDKPLADPTVAVLDRALAGTWQARDPETTETFALTFVPFNDHEMVGFSRGIGSDDKAVSAFRIFVTPVGEEKFLNVQELGETPRNRSGTLPATALSAPPSCSAWWMTPFSGRRASPRGRRFRALFSRTWGIPDSTGNRPSQRRR